MAGEKYVDKQGTSQSLTGGQDSPGKSLRGGQGNIRLRKQADVESALLRAGRESKEDK